MKMILCFGFILPPFTKQCADSILNMIYWEGFILHVTNKSGEGKLQHGEDPISAFSAVSKQFYLPDWTWSWEKAGLGSC